MHLSPPPPQRAPDRDVVNTYSDIKDPPAKEARLWELWVEEGPLTRLLFQQGESQSREEGRATFLFHWGEGRRATKVACLISQVTSPHTLDLFCSLTIGKKQAAV